MRLPTPPTVGNPATRWCERSLIVLACVGALCIVPVMVLNSPFFIMQADSIAHAGTWEDDPRNWFRVR
jgi:hypothetical protein